MGVNLRIGGFLHLSCVSENRKLLGRGKLLSCWPPQLASPQPFEPAVLNITACIHALTAYTLQVIYIIRAAKFTQIGFFF